MKVIKSLEDTDLLMKGVKKPIENEAKEQNLELLSMLLGLLAASLLGKLETGKGVKLSKTFVREVIRTGEGTIELVRIFKVASSFN